MADDPSDAPSADLVDPPASWAGPSISFVPVDHNPFDDPWPQDRFNAAWPSGDPVDPSGMLSGYTSGQSIGSPTNRSAPPTS
jgi:hypothetical protein